MAVRYLLDTNILSDLIRNRDGNVARKLLQLSPGERAGLITSVVVAGELRFGVLKKGSSRLAERVESILASMEVAALEGEVDRRYGRIRSELERRGESIGANDLWIAAHALTLDAVLVTDNTAEFERVAGLRLENWLRR